MILSQQANKKLGAASLPSKCHQRFLVNQNSNVSNGIERGDYLPLDVPITNRSQYEQHIAL